MEKNIEKKLIEEAIKAINGCYAPYSKFYVGAAILTDNEKIYTGGNVENASYPAGICAERVAITSAVQKGDVNDKKHIKAIAIVGGKKINEEIIIDEYCPPCGICRQFIREFANPDKCIIILAKNINEYKKYLFKDLLPESFGPENLI